MLGAQPASPSPAAPARTISAYVSPLSALARCGHEHARKSSAARVMAVAIVLAFGVMMFLTVWYSPDCDGCW
jgi:hypothetical protein